MIGEAGGSREGRPFIPCAQTLRSRHASIKASALSRSSLITRVVTMGGAISGGAWSCLSTWSGICEPKCALHDYLQLLQTFQVRRIALGKCVW